MSYSYERVDRRRRTTGGASYGASARRSTFGYWIPLALTVTAATVGLVAWIWSERRDDEEDSSEEEQYPGGVPPPGYANMSGGLPPGPGPTGFQVPPAGPMGPPSQGGFQGPPPGPTGGEAASYYQRPPPGGLQPLPGNMQDPPLGAGGNFIARSTGLEVENQDDTTIVGRMSGALRRAPSPGQSYDWATGKMAAGVAAAGALIGGALGSIQEGNQDNYEDHERWSEEAESRNVSADPRQGVKRRGTNHEFYSGEVELPKPVAIRQKKRKSVAIVVSAVEHEADGVDEVGHHAVSRSVMQKT